ncbi:hypothetical protein HanXRQr2_Chr14g0658761 [Helianthus annuus]|uniref:Uncharacterized protein n=1 Tax=Helianthus annuus TaxID=4232 RepID=A0A9K3ED78_HELAN|nr:hypothetical protein HanXRQr2_Chr14g0658761 [Helianthus annuus]KAJ0841553.1 hypothetical protein HanPSC8_Chr14g0631691 [Helianthus annuus]
MFLQHQNCETHKLLVASQELVRLTVVSSPLEATNFAILQVSLTERAFGLLTRNSRDPEFRRQYEQRKLTNSVTVNRKRRYLSPPFTFHDPKVERISVVIL